MCIATILVIGNKSNNYCYCINLYTKTNVKLFTDTVLKLHELNDKRDF